MKKIIILMVAAVLMAGILAGCATTSGTTGKTNLTNDLQIKGIKITKNYEKKETTVTREKNNITSTNVYPWNERYEEYAELQSDIYIKYEYGCSTESQREKMIFEDITQILEKPEITKEDLAYIAFLPYNDGNHGPVDASKMPKSKSERKNFTGRIVNNSKGTIKIFNRGYNYKSEIIEIPAGETGYFSIPITENFIKYGCDTIIYVNGREEKLFRFFDDRVHGPNVSSNYLPIMAEIEKTHSFELIYEEFITEEFHKYNRIAGSKYNFKFVEPFDIEN